MTFKEAQAILREHNEWRRGNEGVKMPISTTLLWQAIDVVCAFNVDDRPIRKFFYTNDDDDVTDYLTYANELEDYIDNLLTKEQP